MNIQKIPTADIRAAKYNPRKDLKPGDSEYEKLKRSIETFGYVEPLVWNKLTGNLVGGHQRFKVLKQMGLTEIDCVVVELNDAQEKALNIALNKISGEFDVPLLTDLLKDLKTFDFDTTLTGFDMAELDELFNSGKEAEVKEDNFDMNAALEQAAFVIRGDIWTLGGKHRLLCGDSTNPSDVSRLMNGRKANLVLTDMPYFVNYSAQGKKIKNDDLDDKAAYEFTLAALKLANGVMASDASIYIFHADSKGLIFRQAFADAGFYLSSVCLWVKSNFTFGRQNYKWGHESCLYGWKKSGVHKWWGDQKQSTIWRVDKPSKNVWHITQKPLELMAIPLVNSTMTGAVVYEPFSGSFSTGMVCEQAERVCYAMELDEAFMSASLRRFHESFPDAEIVCERGGEMYAYADLVTEVTNK